MPALGLPLSVRLSKNPRTQTQFFPVSLDQSMKYLFYLNVFPKYLSKFTGTNEGF